MTTFLSDQGAKMKYQIKNRHTDAVLFETDLPEEASEWSEGRRRREAVLADANLAGADLADADLADADLADANLAGAYLAGAYLAGANLARAYLARAYLAGAYLAGADLAGAHLAGADLAGADLAGAYLAGADLAGAYLAGADLAGADLAGAYLADAYLADARNLPEGTEAKDPPEPYVRREPTPEEYAEKAARYRKHCPDVPVVENLDAKILALVEGGQGELDMGSWHSCDTTHCRAGWAVHLAGPAGYALEKKYGPQIAGRMIYRASVGRVPWFFASNEQAIEDLRTCATWQGGPVITPAAPASAPEAQP
jgi:hypothetical protein